MAMKPAPKKVHRTMQGKVIDLDQLRQKNEMTVAVGNSRMNARGDEFIDDPGDARLYAYRQHFLGDCLGDGKKAGTIARSDDYAFHAEILAQECAPRNTRTLRHTARGPAGRAAFQARKSFLGGVNTSMRIPFATQRVP